MPNFRWMGVVGLGEWAFCYKGPCLPSPGEGSEGKMTKKV